MNATTEGAIVIAEARSLTISEVKGNLERVKALMKDVMIGPSKDNPAGIHYGTIPGTPKPTLYQPGAELILMMFRLEAFPMVEDLSTPDVIRYRVKTQIKHQLSGISLGWGIGECSSDEEKYRWRKAVCDQEWDAEDPGRRRIAYKRGKQGSHFTVKQVRTNPADLGNTVLKMASKRSMVGGTRGATAASEVFGQDAEDIDPTLRAEIYGESEPVEEATRTEPGEKKEERRDDTTERSGKIINATQLRILKSAMSSKPTTIEAELCKYFKIGSIELLPVEDINAALKWVAEQK